MADRLPGEPFDPENSEFAAILTKNKFSTPERIKAQHADALRRKFERAHPTSDPEPIPDPRMGCGTLLAIFALGVMVVWLLVRVFLHR